MPERTTIHHVLKEDYDPANPDHVYIGRDFKGFKDCGFGNPFVIGTHGNRIQVIAQYQAWVLEQPELVRRIRQELPGKRLFCFCKVNCKGPACHGEVLANLALSEEEPFGG